MRPTAPANKSSMAGGTGLLHTFPDFVRICLLGFFLAELQVALLEQPALRGRAVLGCNFDCVIFRAMIKNDSLCDV